MTEPTKRRMPLTAAQVHQALPALAILLFALGAWLAWSGWRQQQDASGGQVLKQARDTTVQQTAAALADTRERFRAQLAAPPVQAALATGDLAAAKAPTAGWPRWRARWWPMAWSRRWCATAAPRCWRCRRRRAWTTPWSVLPTRGCRWHA